MPPIEVRTEQLVNAAGATRWPWVSLLPFGLGSWAPIYAGVRARVPLWIVLGIVWVACTVAGLAGASIDDGRGSVAGLLIILGWAGGVATSFGIRASYRERMASPLYVAEHAAEQRLAERREALRLAEAKPRLAREMGVGRPDLPGAADAGLIDLNNAPAAALHDLDALDDATVTQIIEGRAECGGFSSLEDIGMALDLPGDVVEALRDRVVFLPRTSGRRS